jgi:hypothetical protein
MPPIRFTIFKYCVLLITSISFNREIMSPYSHCMKKGLVYIILVVPSSYQPSFYLKYTKANTHLSCNIHSISFNKYIYLTARFYNL